MARTISFDAASIRAAQEGGPYEGLLDSIPDAHLEVLAENLLDRSDFFWQAFDDIMAGTARHAADVHGIDPDAQEDD